MSEIQQPRFRRLLGRYFDTKGGSTPGVLLDDVMPVYQVADDQLADQCILREEYLGLATTGGTAVAAQFPIVQLVNPASSQRLVSVGRIRASSTLATYIGIGLSSDPASTLAPGLQGLARDGRAARNSPQPAKTAAYTNGGATATPGGVGGAAFRVAQVPAATTTLVEMDWVLAPGTYLYVYGGVQNQVLDAVCFEFTERLADQGELFLTGP